MTSGDFAGPARHGELLDLLSDAQKKGSQCVASSPAFMSGNLSEGAAGIEFRQVFFYSCPGTTVQNFSFLMEFLSLDFRTKTVILREFPVGKSFLTGVHGISSRNMEFVGSKAPWKQSASFLPKGFL